MKRIICVLSILALICSFIVFPASADVISNLQSEKFFNLLDYGHSFESENNYQYFKGSADFNFDMPYTDRVSYVDIVFHFWSSSGNDVETAYLLKQEQQGTELDVVKIGLSTYRAIGYTTAAYITMGIRVVTSDPNAASHCSINSFNVATVLYTDALLSCDYDLYTVSDDVLTGTHTPKKHASVDWSAPNDDINNRWFLFDLNISAEDLKKYDYIDFLVTLYVDSVDSIRVEYGDSKSLPFEVSFIDSSGDESSIYCCVIRVDLRGAQRDASVPPTVTISGVGHWVEDSLILVNEVVGHIVNEIVEPEFFWFNKLFNSIGGWFTSLGSWLSDGFNSVVSAITGDSSAAEEAGQNMQDAADDLNNMGNAFDQIETPDIDFGGLTDQFVNFSPSGLTVLATITNNSYVTALLVLVFTFALCAYIFFGKKE